VTDNGFGYYPGPGQYGDQPGWPAPGGYYGPPAKPPRRGGFFSHLLVAVIAAGLAVGVTVAVDHASTSSPAGSGSDAPGAAAVPLPASSSSGAAGSEQQVVNKVEPGLVIINTTMQYDSEAGAATGMVINPDGLVLTNNHVIEDSTKISARVVATGKTYSAKVVGFDTTGDVALIQLQGASGMRTVPLGNSATVKTGAPVVALGNAEGEGTIITAGGKITGLDKTITASDEGGSITSETLHGMLETNAGIVSGDSGGPLVSSSGQVIGMDTAGSSVSVGQQEQQPGAGFAIPIDTALDVARQIASGRASSTVAIGYPPFIGIFIGSGTLTNPQQQAEQQDEQNGFGNGSGGFGGFGYPGFGGNGGTPSCYSSNSDVGVPSDIAPVNSGTLIDGTICDSPAASAGITGGSVITSVDGQSTASPAALTRVMSGLHPGDTVSVTWVSPSGRSTTSHLTLAAGPPQ
jgi:S1-C subfamily serine protease